MAKDSVSVDFDKSFFKSLKALGKAIPECAEKAERDALKKGVSALTDSKGGMPSVYNVKKKDMSQYIKTYKDHILVRSKAFTTVHFGFTPKVYTSQAGIPVKRRKKATLTVMKGRKYDPASAFIANPDAVHGVTMLWQRKKGNRDIEPIRRLSAAQMAENKDLSEYVSKEMQDRFEERLDHYYDLAAKKAGGKK